MLESLSSKAILTKVKAMYGHMLTRADYEQLLHKNSVPACAAFLKNQPGYADVLRDVQETQIHRGALEGLLNKAMFSQFVRLARYAGHENRFFRYYYTAKLEIQFILNCIRLFGSGDQNEFMQSIPGYVVPYMTFDVLALGAVNDFKELLEALRRTPYYKVLEPLVRSARGEGGEVSLPQAEHALYEYYYGYVYSLVDAQFGGSTARELKSLLALDAELFNINAAYRLKRYFGAQAGETEQFILHYKGRLPRRVLRSMVDAPDADGVLDVLSSTRWGRHFSREGFSHIEFSTGTIRFGLAKRLLTFSQNPATVFVAFMVLREIEIENLINIIEGVRYQLDISQIRPLLIQGGA